ncbi:hypothetical protein B0H14DRAFT_2623002 [Mycena olivaceomarginata]|nr:hypothetical protein B0H14DRAFT_2623002 [Mycena olivaceomarginata]
MQYLALASPVPQDLDDPQTQRGVIQILMVDKHNAATTKAKGEAIKLLKDPLLIAQIKALEPFNSPISAAFKDLQQRLQVAKQQAQAKSTLASHREKRKFVDMVGLNKQYRKSIHDILASQQEDSVGSPHNPHILWCYRHPETSVPVCHHQVLADARSRIAEDAIINAENGYETVGSELVIVLACDGVLTQSELALPVYVWLSGVIETASSKRCNVHRNHPGVMTQAGYNAGPCHAQIFGLAKSYNKVLDSARMVQHDKDVISAMSLTWSVCRSFLHTNLISKIDRYLDDARMPTMVTWNVEPGKELVFPNFECGPSEFIMSQDYSASAHRDDCFTEFCLSWTVDRKVDPPKAAQEAAVPAMTALKVKVEMAVGTLIAFCPENVHGTTRLCGAHMYAAMRCFASRIKVAFEKSQQGLSVELHTGAGKGGE